ncbi:MAG: c-type cytochrome biogenesis protein CcmI [Gammaproteobacteria bacterium]|nr:c-type cytochrome biogenesis protein CcmI [Gammaproteobacteria bacterium]
MTVFWVVAVLLIIAALLFLLPPLLYVSQKQKNVRRDKVNVAIHKDKVAELEEDLKNTVLTADQFNSARQELDRSLLDDVKEGDGQQPQQFVKSSITAIIIGLIITLTSIFTYNQIGGGLAAISPNDASVNVSDEGHEGATVEDMIVGLQQRLASNPQDAEGWIMLGRSYYFQKNHREASKAYNEAVKLIGETNPDLLADLADTLAVASNRDMSGRPYELVKKALTLQPFHQKSLWLAGTGAYQAKDFPAALAYWEKLVSIFPPESESAQQIQRNIGEVKSLMVSRGMPVPSSPSLPPQAVSESGSSSLSTAAVAPGASSVSGVVEIAPLFAKSSSPEDTVFIFARAATGPRMPLAILRKQVKDLPIKFVLDDSSSMNPAFKLSKFKDVIVGARVSKSGNAMPQSGDFEGKSSVISVGTTDIPLLINTVVP